jgi:hypothetical protein
MQLVAAENFISFSVFFGLGVRMPEEYVFHARVSKTSHGLLCIYIPKELSVRMGHLHGRWVVIRVTVPDR